MPKISMKNLTLSLIFSVSLVTHATAQQDLCARKVHHITCHFVDGKTITYDTDPAREFYNTRPAMTFWTKDGNLHLLFGDCEAVCRP